MQSLAKELGPCRRGSDRQVVGAGEIDQSRFGLQLCAALAGDLEFDVVEESLDSVDHRSEGSVSSFVSSLDQPDGFEATGVACFVEWTSRLVVAGVGNDGL